MIVAVIWLFMLVCYCLFGLLAVASLQLQWEKTIKTLAEKN
jgi:hypothetical protein